METGRWSGDEPRCECESSSSRVLGIQLSRNVIFRVFSVAVNEAQDESNVGTGVAIAAAIIVILLIFILIVFLHR